MIRFASAVYRLALSLWVGGIAIFSFVVTPILFRTQGRDAAGKIVGTIFPTYFRYVLVLIGIALLSRILSGLAFHGVRRWIGTGVIFVALFLTAYQAFGLTPRMEQVKRSVASVEATPPEDSARREFRRLHGISMVLNILVLLEGAALIVAGEASRRQ
jgi:uncharacterized membrane protein